MSTQKFRNVLVGNVVGVDHEVVARADGSGLSLTLNNRSVCIVGDKIRYRVLSKRSLESIGLVTLLLCNTV